ncbi:MAG: Nramp family divalent metal transporter [Planctomycetaceae bacterium]
MATGPDSDLVPDDVIPHRNLPPLRWRDLPEAPPWRQLVGPSVILAGLALGSGEFIFWPFITYRSGFVFFWACLLGVITQYFLNLEIERWTLATGESAITGFCRLSRAWGPIMLLLNILPWIWPGWATGAGKLLSWLVFGPQLRAATLTVPLLWGGGGELPPLELPAVVAEQGAVARVADGSWELKWTGPLSAVQAELLRGCSDQPEWRGVLARLEQHNRRTGGTELQTPWFNWISIATLWIVGLVLTSSPVVYNTVERLQSWLVLLIVASALVLGVLLIKPWAITAMLAGLGRVGSVPGPETGLEQMALLGALAFAGAGGTMNLGQSNFIKDKGYGMGRYIGRITSPITGNEEAIADVGYHFPPTPENRRRWADWWRAANREHFFSFFLTCVACLVLLTLLAYSLFYTPEGTLRPEAQGFGEDLNFIWGEARLIEASFGTPWVGVLFRTVFLLMGVALLLTTELGVLDATVRISTDILKVNFLRENARWSQSRLYFFLLWGEILAGTAILLAGEFYPGFRQPLFLLKTSAAMNGGVMFIYTVILLYLNAKILPRSIAIGAGRFVAMIWGAGFFGYFTLLALKEEVIPWLWGVVAGR